MKNITFFIGNGFDLNLGLKTQYSDFLEVFLKENNDDSPLFNRIRKDMETKSSEKESFNKIIWSDLEMAMGCYTKTIKTDEVSTFIEEKKQLENELIDYLEKECEKLSEPTKSTVDEIKIGIKNITNGMNKEQRLYIKEWYGNANTPINYNYVIFNYTGSLDVVLDKVKSEGGIIAQHLHSNTMKNDVVGDILHIHGTFEEGNMLGLNDESQIKNPELRNNEELIRCLVKPILNEELGNLKNRLLHDLIIESDIIFIYGMAIGETDKKWWAEIGIWLQNDSKRRLIISCYEEINTSNAVAVVQLYRKYQDLFLERANINEKYKSTVRKQIYVINKSSVFNLPSMRVNQKGDNGVKIIDEEVTLTSSVISPKIVPTNELHSANSPL